MGGTVAQTTYIRRNILILRFTRQGASLCKDERVVVLTPVETRQARKFCEEQSARAFPHRIVITGWTTRTCSHTYVVHLPNLVMRRDDFSLASSPLIKYAITTRAGIPVNCKNIHSHAFIICYIQQGYTYKPTPPCLAVLFASSPKMFTGKSLKPMYEPLTPELPAKRPHNAGKLEPVAFTPCPFTG